MPAAKPFTLTSHSFLRRVDPRTKLLLSLAASAAVMLPLRSLVIFCTAHLALVRCVSSCPSHRC
jgi:energy-coupling factor transporter transmembrane protein EcfT